MDELDIDGKCKNLSWVTWMAIKIGEAHGKKYPWRWVRQPGHLEIVNPKFGLNIEIQEETGI